MLFLLTEMKNSFVGLTLTLNINKKGINKREDKSLEITQTVTQRKKEVCRGHVHNQKNIEEL